jgi:diguanylate cyclase (GGDEF)-like protein
MSSSPWPVLSRSAALAAVRATLAAGPLPVTLIAADLDGFRGVSSSRGPEGVSALLRAVELVISALQPNAAWAERVGGDEYWLLLTGAPVSEALRCAGDMRVQVASADIDGISVTVSAGISQCTAPGGSADTLISQAEAALELAKNRGRNRIEVAGI